MNAVHSFLLGALFASVAVADGAKATAERAPWAVDPLDVGANLPPVGRSLFDFVATVERDGKRVYDVPFPYSAFIQRVEERLQGAGDAAPQLKQVLIPLGRSLQRNAAAPDFFGFPRVVSVVDTDTGSRGERGMMLKDRLYIGYGEKSAILEVISYNEAAARFEFQVVNDYRPGGTPQVAYADRAVCMSCHQNAAPIFSRQTWSETNANPDVAVRLLQKGKEFHGVPVERGVDIPFAIDEAAARANLFAVTQRAWREGCGDGASGARCRAALFAAALQWRLSDARGFDDQSPRYQRDYRDALVARWRQRWPHGIAISDFNIPNRDPLAVINRGVPSVTLNAALDPKGKKLLQDLIANTDIGAPFEPLNRREPLETWTSTDAALPSRVVRGVADFISDDDVRRIDAALVEYARATKGATTELRATCEFSPRSIDARETRFAFTCDSKVSVGVAATGRFYVRDGRVVEANVESLAVRGFELRGISLSAGATIVRRGGVSTLRLPLLQHGLHVRAPDGTALDELTLTWNGPNNGDAPSRGAAKLATLRGFERVLAAVAEIAKDEAFAAAPLRRAVVMPALLQQLNADPGAWCCLDARGMPPALDDRNLPVTAARN